MTWRAVSVCPHLLLLVEFRLAFGDDLVDEQELRVERLRGEVRGGAVPPLERLQ
jgi:hypothetical protein